MAMNQQIFWHMPHVVWCHNQDWGYDENSLWSLTHQVLSLLTDLAQVFWVSVMDSTVFLKVAKQLNEHNYSV